jgi:cytochrome c556
VILATSVITPALHDLAKFLPPPMTPEEAVLDKTMKGVGAANGALRKGIDATNVELIKTNTTVLTKAFSDVEAFWKGRGKDDAVKMAQTARVAAHAIETAAAAANWGDVKTQATTLAQQCSSCHGVYRERLEDGSFAIKAKPQ